MYSKYVTDDLQHRFLEVYAYDAEGRLSEIYQEFNPDVMTDVGFGSARTVYARLVDVR